jgi:hypothetical protein
MSAKARWMTGSERGLIPTTLDTVSRAACKDLSKHDTSRSAKTYPARPEPS